MNVFVIAYGTEQIARCGQGSVIDAVRDALVPPIQNVYGEYQMLIMTTTVIVNVRKIGLVPNAKSI